MSESSIERERRLLEGYDLVLEVPAEERVRFIQERFAADPSLARELERLVEAGERAEADMLSQSMDTFVGPILDDLDQRTAAAHAEIPAALSAVLAPRYIVQEKLGSGGMATVYLAFDTSLGRTVAIKVLLPELFDALSIERFELEVSVLATLDHPRIVPIHDRGGTGELLFYVMRYVNGGSLRDRLVASGQLPIRDAIATARHVAEALDYAHAHNVVHRDIKPENILLDENGAYVADFGVARIIDAAGRESLTAAGLVIGTALYMSPEQVDSGAIDGRSDVYALACVMYEMLAGEPPYTGPTRRDVLAKHMAAAIPDLCVVRGTVSRAMQNAIAKGLQKSPADRFASACQLVDAFEQAYLAPPGEPSPGSAGLRTIVVLPFANTSGDPSKEYFSDGITDDLIGALTRVEGLKVVARTSSFAFKGQQLDVREIATMLGATHVLEGSVRIAGHQLRASAQLVDARNGNPLWSERYDRELEDIFAVQDDITGSIVERLQRDFDVDASGLVLGELREVTGEFSMAAALPQADGTPDALKEATRGLYDIEDVIGSGGMCTIYRAVERATRRTVAIKVLRPTVGQGAELRERLLQQAKAAMQLDHPNIMKVYSARATPQVVYVVTQFIRGRTLREMLDDLLPLPVERAISIIADVGTALSYAHGRGHVHGNLSSHNIIIDGDGSAIVTEFGLAQWDTTELSTSGIVIGTPAYMSPEQAIGGPLTPASDQYSLGALAYELLTHQPPFVGSDVAQTFAKHLRAPVRRLRRLRPAIPAHVAVAVERMLEKEPGDRFADVAEVVDALTAPEAPRVIAMAGAPRGGGTSVWSDFASWLRGLWRPREPARIRVPRRERGQELFGRATFTREFEGEAPARQTAPVQLFAAYDAYLRGRYLLNFKASAESLEEAIQQFDAAIESNVDFARAYAARAYARAMLARTAASQTPALYELARKDADAALSLYPSLAEAHVADALVCMFFEYDREKAVAALDRATAIAPAHAEAHLWRGFMLTWLDGKPDAAIETLERALELDPLSLVARVELAYAYWLKGDNEAALRQADDAVEAGLLLGTKTRGGQKLERAPAEGFASAHHVRAVVLLELGRFDEALKEATEAYRLGGEQTMHLAVIGMIKGMRGDADGAHAVIAELEARGKAGAAVWTGMATVYSGLGDQEKVNECLARAHEAREITLVSFGQRVRSGGTS